MIPGVIRREHVEAAMDEIDRAGVPLSRRSRKFCVSRKEKRYPPKYVISVAFRIATGEELDPATFSGGLETNTTLRKLGFPISECDGTAPSVPESLSARRSGSRIARHDERCTECKQNFESLLTRLYGAVIRNAKFEIPAAPIHLDDSFVSDTLRQIYAALQRARGYLSFVRCKKLPSCDFFVPNPGFIIEFDESQHFTPLRKLTLGFYPSDMHFGFDRERWIRSCDELQARDNDPPFRDEQRAWFDTLRDFAPYIINLMPTIRLRAGEFEWCKLNANSSTDIETFRQLVGEWADFWRLEFRLPTAPKLARIAMDGSWPGSERVARKLLGDVCDRWPHGLHVKCLSTPGAFLRFKWPASVPHQTDNRFPTEHAIRQMDFEARAHVKRLLADGLP
jgi:hypothetical protein